MSKVDEELFRMWGGGIDYALSSDFKDLSDDEKDALYERYKVNLAKQAKQALYKDMLELIGEDDTEVRGTTQNSTNPKYWTKRTKTKNELRQELRNKLKEYFGITE